MRVRRASTRLLPVLAVAGILFAVVACGGGDDDSGSGAPAEPAAVETTEPAEPPTSPEPPEPAPPAPPEEEPPPPPDEPPPAPPPADEPPPEPAPPEPVPAEPTAPAEEAGEEFETPTGVTCTTRAPDPPPDPPMFDAPPELALVDGATYTATLETSCGQIVLELDPVIAPLTTNNFVELARAGFYDGLTFHRAVSGFVIQGGDPFGNGTGGPGYSFEDELPTDGYAIGDLAMANAGPDTNGSQYFIVTGDASFLPPDFSKFGRVTEGLEIAQAIESLGDASQQLAKPVYVYSVTITES